VQGVPLEDILDNKGEKDFVVDSEENNEEDSDLEADLISDKEGENDKKMPPAHSKNGLNPEAYKENCVPYPQQCVPCPQHFGRQTY
jgi:hypothetical protein